MILLVQEGIAGIARDFCSATARIVRSGVRDVVTEATRARLRMRRDSAVKAYLNTHPQAKLHVGAGSNVLSGWLNTDLEPAAPGVVYLDASEPFPFSDSTFDYVFCEHLIEHLPHGAGRAMLRECRRVLRPGGRVRVATPDLTVLIRLFAPGGLDGPQKRYVDWVCDRYFPEEKASREVFVLNNAFRNYGHMFLYDAAALTRALEMAGFTDIARQLPGESVDPELAGIEGHGDVISDGDINTFETMVMEAVRGR